MEMTDMKGEIKVKKIELRLRNAQYAIVTLESGDKFAIKGELEDNSIDLKVEEIEDSISPYYMVFGSQEEYDKAYNHYLTAGVIKDLKIAGLEDFNLYEMVKEYECAIADAIIDYAKLHNTDTVIHFCDYPKPPISAIESKIIMTDMKGKIKVKKIEIRESNDIYNQYAIVTLESGDKFAVRGELENNLVDFKVDRIEDSIRPYYMEFGSEEESDKAYNNYLAAGVIKDVKIKGFENVNFYEMVKEYECAIADAIIDHAKLHNTDTVIHFIDYQKHSIPAIEPKNDNTLII